MEIMFLAHIVHYFSVSVFFITVAVIFKMLRLFYIIFIPKKSYGEFDVYSSLFFLYLSCFLLRNVNKVLLMGIIF